MWFSRGGNTILKMNLDVEVESVIESVVAKVLADSPSTKHHRITLVNKLVAALEHDAGWVELYGITGELNVPVTPYEQTEYDLCHLLDSAMKVQKILWVAMCSQLMSY
jgi:hypothetical protein